MVSKILRVCTGLSPTHERPYIDMLHTGGGLEFLAAAICIKAKLNVGAPFPSAVPDLVSPRWDSRGG